MRLDGLTDRPRRTRRPPWHVTRDIALAYLVAGALVAGCVTSIKSGKVLLIDSFDNPAAGRLSSQSDDPAVEQGYIGGEYQVRLSSSAKPLRVVGANSVFANLQVAVDARLAEGTEGRSIGVACRMNPKDGTAQQADVTPWRQLRGAHLSPERHGQPKAVVSPRDSDRLCIPLRTLARVA